MVATKSRTLGGVQKVCAKKRLRAFFFPYHPFQNHYTHDIIIFELFRGLQLQLSGFFRNNEHCSYIFLFFERERECSCRK